MKGRRVVTLRQEQFHIEMGHVWQLAYSVTVPGSTDHYIGFVTGPYEAEIDDRLFTTEGTDTVFTLYTSTSYTNGTALTLWNRHHSYQNDDTKKPVTDIKGGVTASPVAGNLRGTVSLTTVGASERVYGDQSSANIILSPSTSYVIGIRNNDSSAADCTFAAILIQRSNKAWGWYPL